MNNHLKTISQHVVDLYHWEWMPGMKDLQGWRLYEEFPIGGWNAIGGQWEEDQLSYLPTYPDFSDSATVGCLLTLVRKVWNDPAITAFAIRKDDAKIVWSLHTENPNLSSLAEFQFEAELLVAALAKKDLY